jgi:hypothetical protein
VSGSLNFQSPFLISVRLNMSGWYVELTHISRNLTILRLSARCTVICKGAVDPPHGYQVMIIPSI